MSEIEKLQERIYQLEEENKRLKTEIKTIGWVVVVYIGIIAFQYLT